ncbi:MFS transporter [Tengunoibacter tsumagoiensis]|uniref:MFS transporter n=1 Tax=Tengunoibacter tsumagoiensis TaxID=2014871 RepID=A0A401ZYH3_9CHLR|nr:MFS transporter [Tengunoibacter tsumagoiensis]GCE11899.1 MFS transporter [Tengunoibacter tsumagoiensis]
MEISEAPGVASPPTSQPLQPVSIWRQINLNVFWMANQFHWQALSSIVLPSMVAKLLDPQQQNINLALVIAWGTLAAVFVNPLAGALSDYLPFRLGRRRPFMLIGTILNLIVLVVFAFTPNLDRSILLFMLAILYFLLQCSNNFANSPWSAIIADQVPVQQRGFTAGLNGLALLLGTALGSIVAGSIVNKHDALPVYKNEITLIFLIVAVVQMLFVAYTILTVKETPLPPEQYSPIRFGPFFRKFFFKPSQYPDLSWVLLARLLVMLGIWAIFYFLQYYADEVLNVSGEKFIGQIFLPLLLVVALPTSVLAGWLSDRWSRKKLVYISGITMTLVCLLFIFWQNTTGALIAAAFFGIGYGAYTSVDWALVTDTLPPTDEAGKFLGLWSAMGILPQVVGISLGGILLQLLQGFPNHLGYTILFSVTVFYFILGTIVISRVKSVR